MLLSHMSPFQTCLPYQPVKLTAHVIVVRRRVSLCVAMKVLLKEASPDPLTQARTGPYLFCITQLKGIIKECLLS